ncbi:hypothetical protein TcWFU_006485 [Taenia crassiceps]|uniref:Uncharacterized protein n=1 Tax=Taenia crassiceps TaxID=6207 RepID=A0ABR4QRW5_9CEST
MERGADVTKFQMLTGQRVTGAKHVGESEAASNKSMKSYYCANENGQSGVSGSFVPVSVRPNSRPKGNTPSSRRKITSRASTTYTPIGTPQVSRWEQKSGNSSAMQRETHLRSNEYFDSTSRVSPHGMKRRPENGEKIFKKQRSTPSYTEDMLRRYSISDQDQFAPTRNGYAEKYYKNGNGHENCFEKENLFKSKSHQNLWDEDEAYRKYSVPNQSYSRPRPTGGTSLQNFSTPSLQELRDCANSQPRSYRKDSGPQKFCASVEAASRGSLSKISDNGERHRRRSSEGDFFEDLNAFVKSQAKESGNANRSTTKVHPVNISASQPEKVLPSAKTAPETKTLAPVRKLAGTLNSSVGYEEAGPTECRSADPIYHQVRDSPIKSAGRGPYTTPTPGQKYNVAPQVIPPRPRTEPKFYQKSTSLLSAEEKPRLPPQSPAYVSPSIDSNSNGESHIYSDNIRDSLMKSTTACPSMTPALEAKYSASPQAIAPRLRAEPKFYQKPMPFPSVEEKTWLPSQSPKKLGPRMDINSTSQRPVLSDKKVVIIDIGHYYVRAGVLRDGAAKPDLCLPNLFGVTSAGFLFGDAVSQITDPEFAKSLGSTSIISPLRQSQITSPINVEGTPIQKDFFLTVLRQLNLHEYGKGFKLLLCLPTRASALRPYFIDYFLGPSAEAEGFGLIEAVASISAFRAALQTTKVSTCLVISLSADLEIIPLAEGGLVEHGRSTIALYGEEALGSLMKEMVKGNIDLSEQEIKCFGHYIYREAAFIENKETKCHDVVIDLSQYGPYPVNKRISVPAELRRKASDALLRPEQACTYDGELPSFKTLLNRAIQSCDVDLRSAICSNVLLIGEFADIEGLRERVSEEMQVFLPEGASPPTVQVAKNAAGLAYDGACLLSTVLQGPQPPHCPWFRFVDAKAWSLMRSETGCSTSFSGTRLLSRLNRDCLWP